jgi:methyl-accepting chemotaxis protein
VLALSQVQSNGYHTIADLLQLCASSDPLVIKKLEQNIIDLHASSAKNLAFYESTPFTPEEQSLYDEAKRTRVEFLSEFDEVLKIGRSTDPVQIAKAQTMFEQQLRPLYEKYSEQLQTMVDMNKKGANAGMDSIQGSVTSTGYGVWIGVALCIAFAVPLSIFIVRGITRPLGLAVDALKKVADKDLSVVLDVDSRDEIGQMADALNAALEKLRTTLTEVAEGAASASASSQELAAATTAIASGAQEQAASLEETSASLEEITATVRQSADNAKEASQLASGSKDSAEKGRSVVASAVTAMEEINAASAKISEIISTIDEIAFQTNLLAVNAAVEAARAGEQGRGFAVVASEVRSLAQRSAGAAKEIKGLIQDSLKKVEKGSELVNRSGETLQGIVSSVTRVTDIVGEIAAASEEQSTGVEQVNTAMTQMDQVTQSNAAQTEELSSTAQSLSDQATRLMELVATFKLDNDSGRNSGRALRPASAKRASVQLRIPIKTVKGKAAGLAGAVSGNKRVAVRSASLAMATAHGNGDAGGDDASFEEF